MSKQVQLPYEKVSFITEIGRLAFTNTLPGDARPPKEAPNKLSYGCEWSGPNPGQSIVDAVSFVAQNFDSGVEPPTVFMNGQQYQNPVAGQPRWKRHVFGPTGRIRRLEEFDPTQRDFKKYDYAAGMFVIPIKKTLSLKSVKMDGQDLADPAVRKLFTEKVALEAPKTVRYIDQNNPFDMAWVENENRNRILKGVAPMDLNGPEQHFMPVQSSEIWSGCYGRVAGRCYWDDTNQKTVLLALDAVLLTGPGERLSGGSVNPDRLFGGFAPPAHLAPGFAAPALLTQAPTVDWTKLLR